jgi:hypothetical protein
MELNGNSEGTAKAEGKIPLQRSIKSGERAEYADGLKGEGK